MEAASLWLSSAHVSALSIGFIFSKEKFSEP